MIAVISFLIIFLVSLIIVRIATVMLKLTGLSEDIAKFQARSAFSGTGFTSGETELIMNNPIRRKIVQNLIVIGNIGLVTFISSLFLSFLTGDSDEDLLLRLGIILGGALLIFLITKSRPFNRIMSIIVESSMKKWSRIYSKDYDSLLFLSGEYEIVKIQVKESTWLADRQLFDLRLNDEGILVIGIRRPDGHYSGSPRSDSVIFGGDELILYGRETVLKDIGNRPTGSEGDEEHQRNVEMIAILDGVLPPQKIKKKKLMQRIFKKNSGSKG